MKLCFLIFLILIPNLLLGESRDRALIPMPVIVEWRNGGFIVDASTSVSYNSLEGKNCANILVLKINRASGFSLKSTQGLKSSIQLILLDKVDSILSNEGYSIDVTQSKIRILANKPAGLFYGVQTLLQLFPVEIESKVAVKKIWEIPAVKITDFPRFAWRGLMLDVSRHFFSKDEVKLFVDQMTQFKYNTLHLHLTDDHGWRIEIKSLPRLTEVGAWRVPRAGRFGERESPKPNEVASDGGFYSQADIRELIQYAESKYVTIVPEIDVPGHCMAAIASYPELGCTKDSTIKVNPGSQFSNWYENNTFKINVDNTLNPSSELVYQFLDKVFSEVALLFPSKYIHVGGDECYKGFWAKDADCKALMKSQNIHHTEDLQGYFMQRVEKILASKGKKMVGWDEVLEGGVSSSVAIMNWRSPEIGAEASQNGHCVIMSPTAFAYLDYCQGDATVDPPVYASLRLKNCYNFNPLPEGANVNNILGGQGNLWTENISTFRQIQYMLYPRAWALSEVFWSPNETKNWDNFVKRAEAQFERADVGKINYSHAIYDAVIELSMKQDKRWLQLSVEAPNVDIYFTIDDSMPDNYSAKYNSQIELPDGPITLRVITYRNSKPIGHLITLKPSELKKRIR